VGEVIVNLKVAKKLLLERQNMVLLVNKNW